MIKIGNKTIVELYADETHYVSEASSLGWHPGFIPSHFIFYKDDGIEKTFELQRRRICDIINECWVYKSKCGRYKITILND